MRRRDLSKVLLAWTAAAPVAGAKTNTNCARPCYPPTPAETLDRVLPSDLSYPPGNVLRWGADPTGAADSTQALQRAVDAAWASGFYGSPWSGKGGAAPVLLFPPGRYRVTDTITVPTGVTLRGAGHPANTTSHTRIIMDSPGEADNRDKPMFRFSRTTRDDTALMNTAITCAIENLEFWFVTMGGTFDRPMGAGIPFGKYPHGGILMFDVDADDTRIVNCVFQHSPAAVRITDVGSQEARRGDGRKGNRGVGLFLENCEFDASCAHVYATASELDLQFKGCQFFGGMHRYENCTGKIVYQGGRWHGDAYIDAGNANALGKFELGGADVELGAHVFLTLNKAALLNVSHNSVFGGVSAASWLEVTDAEGGCITANAVDSSGCNAASGTGPADFTAVIRLLGCRRLLVSSNNITAMHAGEYRGFGILSGDSARPAGHNFVNGNAVSAPYEGPVYEGQGRYINLRDADVAGQNYCYDSRSHHGSPRSDPL